MKGQQGPNAIDVASPFLLQLRALTGEPFCIFLFRGGEPNRSAYGFVTEHVCLEREDHGLDIDAVGIYAPPASRNEEA